MTLCIPSIRIGIGLLLLVLGAERASALEGDFIASETEVTPAVIGTSDLLGDAVAFVENLDGSGNHGLAIGRPGASPSGAAVRSGLVDVLELGPGGTASPFHVIEDNTAGDPDNVFALAFDDGFGSAIAFLGDLDAANNGRIDLAVGAMDSDESGSNSGSVWVLSISQDDGEPRAGLKIAHNAGGLGALSPGDQFGSALATLGDWDGDGVTDLAVGAMGDDVVLADQGSIYILYMNMDGSVRHDVRINVSEGGFGGVVAQGENFGSSIAMIADQNGDGRPDLAVGAASPGLTGASGSVWLLDMGPGCFANTAMPSCTVLDQTEITSGTYGLDGTLGNSARFGESLAWVPAASGLDVDRLLIGAPSFGGGAEGAVFVAEISDGVLSGSRRIGDLTQWNVDLINSQQFGSGVAGIGDVNTDGISDFAFGARGTASRAGRAFTAVAETCPTLILRPVVYHSPTGTGQDPCRPVFMDDTIPPELDLWIESGGASSTPGPTCDATTGDGEEMCAWDIRLVLEGAYTLDPLMPFLEDTTNFAHDDIFESDSVASPQELRLNWVRKGAAAAPTGPFRLGTVRMVNDGSGPAVVRIGAGSAAVGARLQYQPIGQRAIALPEPAFGVGLAAGGVLLARAARRRRRAVRGRALRFAAIAAFALLAATVANAQSIKTQIRISENESLFPRVGIDGTGLGYALGTPGDVDLDGTTDLALGCCSLVATGHDARIYMEFLGDDGAPAGPPGEVQPFGTDFYARSIEGIPDRDGDGIPELLVGTPTIGNGPADQVSMIFLNANGTRKATRIQFGPGLPTGFTAVLGPSNDFFGEAVAWLGDADGVPATQEFMIGTPGDDATDPDAGSVWIASLDATNTITSAQRILPTGIVVGQPSLFGTAIAAIGDIDGNGVTDVAIGAFNGPGNYGSVSILRLRAAIGGGSVEIEGSTFLGNGFGGLPNPLPTGFNVTDLALVTEVPNGGGVVLAVGEDHIANDVYMIHVLADGTARNFYRIYDGAGVGETLSGSWTNGGFGSAVAGPGDLDGDGVDDLVVGAVDAQRAGGGGFSTGEGAVFLFHMIDSDFDGLDDELDNCAGGSNIDPVLAYNPLQDDADGDGVGDLCDVCPNVADPLQIDSDGDKTGDLCEPVSILLESTGTLQTPSWDLLVDCGAYDVTEVNVGVVPPSSAAVPPLPSFSFACPAPPAGGACATVDLGMSTAPAPGVLPDPGVRTDSIYVHAVGGAIDGTLCQSGAPRAKIGELSTGAISTTSVASAALTEEGVGSPGLGLPLALDGLGPIPDAQVELVNGDPLPRVTINLGPAVVTGGNTRWDVLLYAEHPDDRFHRVAFGLVAPSGTDPSDMKWVGCEDPTIEPGEVRTCLGAVAPTINPLNSWTVGPANSGNTPSGLRTHTMYVVLEGDEFYPPAPTKRYINIPDFTVTLGTIEFTGTPELEPALTLEGVDQIDNRLGVGKIDPFERSDAPLLGDLDEVRLVGRFNPAEDADGDFIQDLADNCPYAQNVDQADGGGPLGSTDANGRGDRCECGDGSLNGIVDTSADDVNQVRQLLAGMITTPQVVADVEARCSVASGVGCDIRDVALLQQLVDNPDVPETRCDAALSPGPDL